MPVERPLPGSTRARIAVAGATAATKSRFGTPARGDKTANAAFVAVLAVGLGAALAGLAGIIIWAAVEGWPYLSSKLITEGPSTVDIANAGYRPAILGTVYLIGGVLILIVPLGVGSAIFLEEFADQTRWWNRLIELNIQNLAGVPSIVFGILGLGFIARGPLDLGFVAAAGSLTLALLVLPTVILASREAIKAVPPSIREGSLALGVTQWQTVRRQVLPAALPGIMTGVILAVSRAIGETAPLLLVGAATFVTFDPDFFSSRYSALPVQIFTYAGRPQDEFRILAAAGVILMLAVVLLMNSFAIWLRNRYEQRI